jgi:hypothetical protein
MPMDRDKVAKILTERGATKPCHRCGHTNFAVIEGYSSFSLQENLDGNIVLGGPAVPVAMVACGNCGAITPHALGALGLLPPAAKG